MSNTLIVAVRKPMCLLIRMRSGGILLWHIGGITWDCVCRKIDYHRLQAVNVNGGTDGKVRKEYWEGNI